MSRLSSAAAQWASPLACTKIERPISVSCPSDKLALVSPPHPDQWMLQGKSRAIRQYGRKDSVKVTSTRTIIIQKNEDEPSTIQKIKDGSDRYYVMHIGKQKPLSREMARSLVQEMQLRKLSELQRLYL